MWVFSSLNLVKFADILTKKFTESFFPHISEKYKPSWFVLMDLPSGCIFTRSWHFSPDPCISLGFDLGFGVSFGGLCALITTAKAVTELFHWLGLLREYWRISEVKLRKLCLSLGILRYNVGKNSDTKLSQSIHISDTSYIRLLFPGKMALQPIKTQDAYSRFSPRVSNIYSEFLWCHESYLQFLFYFTKMTFVMARVIIKTSKFSLICRMKMGWFFLSQGGGKKTRPE